MAKNDHLEHKTESMHQAMINTIRRKVIELDRLIELLPPSRERSIALTKLEETRMWAIKATTLDCEVIEVEK